MEKFSPDNSGNWIRLSAHSEVRQKQAASSGEAESRPLNKHSRFTGTETHLSRWMRSLCNSNDYPAFGDPEPVVLPDMLTEQMSDFEGFACYETKFVLDKPMIMLLEILDTAGSVEVYMNGDTAGMRITPPYHYDLSILARKGKNYLAVEIAVNLGQKDRVNPEPIQEKSEHGKQIKKSNIIGSIRLYTK
ncbi:MAG: hypothetical protein LBB83_03725 [Treponema sp.]|nr:hypothetical protein [Treponema sp.]